MKIEAERAHTQHATEKLAITQVQISIWWTSRTPTATNNATLQSY